jgi:hypothetical protein
MIMASMSRIVSVVLAVSAACSQARAWDEYGHELVAAIAYQDLKPETKARVNALLKQHPRYDVFTTGCPKGFDVDQYAFMRCATWPEIVQVGSDPSHRTDHHPKWHSVAIPIEMDGMHSVQPRLDWKPGVEPENSVQALLKMEADLKNAAVREADKAKDLCWMCFLVGEVHQPLRTATLVSAQYPKGDDEGQLFWVTDGRPIKLRSYWDEILGTSKDPTKIPDRAKQVSKIKENSRKAMTERLEKAGYDEWAKESAELARSIGYRDGAIQGAKPTDKDRTPKDAPALPQDYREQAEKVAQTQAALAGYRLADKLNELLGDQQQP